MNMEIQRAGMSDMTHEHSGMTHEHSGEHADVINLVPQDRATHVAVKAGSWFDPSTWQNGQIPGNGANVLIPHGISVLYDGESDARLRTIRLDGNLTFSHNQNTQMVIDTFIANTHSTLQIGSESNPIAPDKQARLIFAPVDSANGAIDKRWDPTQLSRGLIALPGASVDVWGAEKNAYVTLEGNHSAGANQLVLSEEVPTNWQVGDQIVVTGTQWNANGSHADNSKTQDEVLTITSIQGNTITFSHNDVAGDRLRFDHTIPDGFDLQVYVANVSRNVRFETEGGNRVPIAQRGHTMFHDHDTEIHNAGFYALGRTNKDLMINDPEVDSNGQLVPGTGSNARGRYPIHLHKVFSHDPMDAGAAHISGNAVWGSPGWGVAIHGSRAVVEDNVSFDVVGAHFVTEDGDEQAAFRRNIAIKAAGATTDPKAFNTIGFNQERMARHDLGNEGIGFWLDTAYSVTAFEDNIATGTADSGIIMWGQEDSAALEGNERPSIPVANLPEDLRAIAGDDSEILSWKVPVRNFRGNTVYNSDGGIQVRGQTRDDSGVDTPFGIEHNLQSVYEDFKIWGVREYGVRLSYAAHLTFKDSLIVGDPKSPILRDAAGIPNPRGIGIFGDKNVTHIVYDNVHIEGFDVGLSVPQTGYQGYNSEIPFGKSQLIGGTFKNNNYHLYAAPGREDNPPPSRPLSTLTDTAPLTPYFEIKGNPNFDVPTGDKAPTAVFTTKAVGGLAVQFDASQSVDEDYKLTWADSTNHPYTAGNNTIASFAWDFNNDGVVDDFGRYVTHHFDQPGSRTVTLEITDIQGNQATISQDITVTEQPTSGNLVQDSGFDRDIYDVYGTHWSYALPGTLINRPAALPQPSWFAGRNSKWNYDAQRGWVYADDAGAPGLVQFIYDQTIQRGLQTIRFDATNEGSGNTLRLQVFGLNGEFEMSLWRATDPSSLSNTVPLESDLLLDTGNVATTGFDWTTFTWDNINFGEGYDFIGLRFLTDGVSSSEFQAIDNVFIGSSAGDDPAPEVPLVPEMPLVPEVPEESSDLDADTDITPPGTSSEPDASLEGDAGTPSEGEVEPDGDNSLSSESNTSGSSILYEAEQLDLTGYTIEDGSGSGASNGQQISLHGVSERTGTASGVFNGEAGTYQVKVGYYDENDGVSQATVTVAGVSQSFEFSDDLPSSVASPESLTSRVTHAAIDLKPGDRFEIAAQKGGGEFARFDSIEFSPVTGSADTTGNEGNPTESTDNPAGNTSNINTGDTSNPAPDATSASTDQVETATNGSGSEVGSQILYEAEQLALTGYKVETFPNSGASGGQNITLRGVSGGKGAASGVFNGEAGFYQVKVSYYDESDGVSQATITVGGNSQSFEFSDDLPSYAASPASLTSRVTHELIELKPGDRFEITAQKNAGEFARFDSIEFSRMDGDNRNHTPTPQGTDGSVSKVMNFVDTSGHGIEGTALEFSGSTTQRPLSDAELAMQHSATHISLPASYLAGSDGEEQLTGTNTDDAFEGKGGRDIILSQGGQDWFIYRSPDEGVDILYGFGADDRLLISSEGFGGGLIPGTSVSEADDSLHGTLVQGSAPIGNHATFLYQNGLLSFDADGLGSSAPAAIAQFQGNPSLSAQQLVITA